MYDTCTYTMCIHHSIIVLLVCLYTATSIHTCTCLRGHVHVAFTCMLKLLVLDIFFSESQSTCMYIY